MKLSIVTNTFNQANELRRLYESLLPQQEYIYEWIITDDGSTDNTWQVITELVYSAPFLTEGIQQVKKGHRYAVSLNNGLQKATGDLVFSVNGDTYLTPTTLKNLVRSYIPGSVGSATRINVDTEGNFVSYDWRTPAGNGNIVKVNDFPEFYTFLTGNGLIVERETLEKYGGFDERFIGYGRDDWEYFLRLGRKGVPLYQYNNVQVIVDAEAPKQDNPNSVALFERILRNEDQ